MYKLEPPNKVGVESRAQAEQAFSALRHEIERTHADPQTWLRDHDPVTAAIVMLRRTNSTVKAGVAIGKWVDRHIYHVLGLGGWARAILGTLTWEEVCKLAPNPQPQPNPLLQSTRTAVVSVCQSQLDKLAADEGSSIVEQRNGTSGSGDASSLVRKLEPDQQYTNLADELANRLQAKQQVNWSHDDFGSRVGSSTLAAWTSGAYITPLVEVQQGRGRISVSILVDVSGSTQHIAKHLWGAACAVRNAMIRVGNACAIDRWDFIDHTTEGPYHTPVVVDWCDPETWVEHGADGGTDLSTSATPAMGRLQSTAPSGTRQLVIVITDGHTADDDRRNFLQLAACPAMYVTVNFGVDAKMLLDEGWSAVVNVKSDGGCGAIVEDAKLQALLGA